MIKIFYFLLFVIVNLFGMKPPETLLDFLPFELRKELMKYDPEFQEAAKGFAMLSQSRKKLQPIYLKGHKQGILHAEFSPLDNRLLTVSRDSTACIWDLNHFALLHMLSHTNPVLTGTFNKKADKIVTGCSNGDACIWDASNGKQLFTFYVNKPITTAEFHANDKNILITCQQLLPTLFSTDIFLYDIIKKEDFRKVPSRKAIFHPHEDIYAAIEELDSITNVSLYDFNGIKKKCFFLQGNAVITDFSFDKKGNLLFCTSGSNPLTIWDINTGTILFSRIGEKRLINKSQYMLNEKFLYRALGVQYLVKAIDKQQFEELIIDNITKYPNSHFNRAKDLIFLRAWSARGLSIYSGSTGEYLTRFAIPINTCNLLYDDSHGTLIIVYCHSKESFIAWNLIDPAITNECTEITNFDTARKIKTAYAEFLRTKKVTDVAGLPQKIQKLLETILCK